MKIPKILTNMRILILIFFILLAVAAIHPSNQEGIAVRFVEKDSAAYIAGMQSPEKNSLPLNHEVITSVNGKAVKTVEEYYNELSDVEANRTIRIKTNQNSYTIRTLPEIEIEYTGNIIQEEINETIDNETITKIIDVNETIEHIVGVKDIGLTIYQAPQNNIRKGLDLQGGVRVLLTPEERVDDDVIDQVVENLDQRLNAFGLSDVKLRKSEDLSGNQFILVEIAGLQKKEIESLIATQGKFEAKVANTTVFSGGDDVTYVCRSADCSGIDPRSGCGQTSDGGHACQFFFTVDLSAEAAQRQADATADLEVITGESGQEILSEQIDFYLDDQLVDSLNIGAGLKGRAETTIQITGSGAGNSREEAVSETLSSMKRLQTILKTGSLPVKLEIVKADNLSPILGKEFLRTAIMIGMLAILVVAGVVLIRYRSFKIAIPMIITNISEVVLLLGTAAAFGTNLDLAAIAGIIIVVGTGVDHQIVIADELLRKETQHHSNWKAKMKNAFFIIMAAYFTTFVAMIPLIRAGAGILRGFAITTLIGVSIGVFITRPAYGAMLENWLKK